jgi:hypothetical protein
MFIGLGTAINIVTIVAGAGVGVLVGGRMSERTRSLITDVLGLVTILGAASALVPMWNSRYITALPQGWSLLVILASLLLGGIIGSALSLEDRLDSFGQYLRKKFRAKESGTFIEGFVSASLLFAIGPLAILGSISDGMGTGIDQLLLKSSLDFFAAINDGKLSDEEIIKLASKWGLTNKEVADYAKKISEGATPSSLWPVPGNAAEKSWKDALAALNSYIAATKVGLAPIDIPSKGTQLLHLDAFYVQ